MPPVSACDPRAQPHQLLCTTLLSSLHPKDIHWQQTLPLCFTVFFDKKRQSRVLNLKIYCDNKANDCDWVGWFGRARTTPWEMPICFCGLPIKLHVEKRDFERSTQLTIPQETTQLWLLPAEGNVSMDTLTRHVGVSFTSVTVDYVKEHQIRWTNSEQLISPSVYSPLSPHSFSIVISHFEQAFWRAHKVSVILYLHTHTIR